MTEKLEDLPPISRVSHNAVRVLGQNPGKFTLQGTNTYILGSKNPYILLDTAEGKPEYIPFLASALDTLPPPSPPSLPEISDLLISHWHGDHVSGLPSVLALLHSRWQARNPTSPLTEYPAPKLHKYPIPSNDPGNSPLTSNKLPEIIKALPQGTFTPTPDGKPFHDLHDNQLIRSSSLTIRVLHTPGHTVDSICLEIAEDRALYTADTVLGQGTAVFEDFALYMQSLNKMLKYREGDSAGYKVLYPAHGPVVESGRELISTYIKHRMEREQQVLDTLRKAPIEGANWTTWTIVKTLYAAYPENLWVPASYSITLHLKKLQGEGIIQSSGGEGVEAGWELVSRTRSPAL